MVLARNPEGETTTKTGRSLEDTTRESVNRSQMEVKQL
jgi:hypothetical protein